MNIALATRALPPQPDSVGGYTFHLAEAFAQKGHRVLVLASEPSAGEGGETRPFTVRRLPGWWRFRTWPRLMEELRRFKPDLVNLQYIPQLYSRDGLHFGVALLPSRIRREVGCPVVTTCHELLAHHPTNWLGKFLQIAYGAQAWLILRNSAGVIVPVEWQEKQLLRCFSRFGSKIRRIPVGTNVLPLPLNSIPSRPSPSAETVLGTFGTGPWWDHAMALDLLRALLDRNVHARLLILGDIEGSHPTYYFELRKKEASLRLAGRVEWSGRLSAAELSEKLRWIGLFLAFQPAGVTARSTALAAALSHGLAIVATRGPDADRWLIQSGAMEIIPPDRLEEAVERVQQLLENPSRRESLSARAQAFFREHLSWEKISDRYLQAVSEWCP